MNREKAFQFLQATSVLLFTLQALRVMFSVLFGIIYDGIFEGPFSAWLVLSNLLLVAVFLVPGILLRRSTQIPLSTWVVISGLVRIGLSVNLAMVRYWSSLLLILAGLIVLLGLLRRGRSLVFPGVVLALSLDQLFRVLGTTFDITLRPWWIPLQILWALLLIWMTYQLHQSRTERSEERSGIGFGEGLAMGGFLFLQLSLLSLPNGMARWSEISYQVIAPLLLAITALFLVRGWGHLVKRWLGRSTTRWICFAALLVGLLLGYFSEGLMAIFGLLIAQIAALVMFSGLGRTREGFAGHTATALSLGMLFFLILNFLNAFAFTYPYTIPAMRDMGWFVYLIAGVSLAFLVPRVSTASLVLPLSFEGLALLPMIFAVLLSLISVWPRETTDLEGKDSLRVATYNIHYGYDDDWRYALEEMADTIEENGCDVVALQEVDAGRLTSYAVDNALYLARRLKMKVLYLPTVEHLTGIALLYRGTPLRENTSLLTSLQEQTGIVQVSIGHSGDQYHAFGIWMGLGNENTKRQIGEALAFIGDHSPAVFGGDFNASPKSDIADEIRQAGFLDPFERLDLELAANTSPAIHPEKRIDFVWVRGLEPLDAWVSDSLASDHRMVVVEVAFP